MQKTIPAVTVTICDCCTRECSSKIPLPEGQTRRTMGGKMMIRRDALDMQGHAVSDDRQDLDLCDRCVSRMGQAINDLARAVRAEDKAKESEHA